MTSLKTSPLSPELTFGASIEGLTIERLDDQTIRDQLIDTFERQGLIIFRDVEPSTEMHLKLSSIFGPLAHHGLTEDKDGDPEVVNLKQQQDVVEIDGKRLGAYLPWHFDACYTATLNRAAILRPVELPPSGGMTGFADGIQLYNAISPKLRELFKDLKVIYHPKLMFMHQRFGVPPNQKWISLSDPAVDLIEKCADARRAVHPAIWRRDSGEWVLHVSPWQAAGIYGRETPEDDELLEALCQEIYEKMTPYWHEWKPNDMLLWDNWRYLHSVSGNDPGYVRHMQRATIEGDYGLGFFEEGSENKAEAPTMG